MLHLFDNSIYKGEVDGELTDPIKLNGTYPIKLKLIDSSAFNQLFETALPVIKCCIGFSIILLGPLPRYLLNKCCEDPSHINNFVSTEYLAKMSNNIKLLRNLVHKRRLNPAVLMGVMDSTEAHW